jgi:hypothetical protein
MATVFCGRRPIPHAEKFGDWKEAADDAEIQPMRNR